MCDDSTCHTYHNWLINYYYGEGGVIESTEDPNLNTVTFGYKTSGGAADPYWRLSSKTDPLGTTTYYTYPTASAPRESSQSMTFGSSIEARDVTTDAYDRVIDLQVPESTAQTSFDTASNTYGWNGNYGQIQYSQPCLTTGLGTGCPSTPITTLYDALNRLYSTSTTNNSTLSHTYSHTTSGQDRLSDLMTLSPAPSGESTTKTESLFDGLGRIANIFYVGNGNSSACTGDSANVGLNQGYSYMAVVGSPNYEDVKVTRGVQTRETHVDALGRTVQTITPEAGTWNYKYDSDSSCPSGYQGMNGMLASTRDPNGNMLCYAYDTERRITGVNANGTSCRHFYYDNSTGYSGTVPSGITPTNPYFRLVEAAADSCAASTLITDEWFAYDPDGRILDTWELTPHSTQYYHSNATFFANGAPKTVQLASPSFYTMTFGLDGEARLYSVSDTSHSKTIVNSANYFHASNPSGTKIFGSDSYSFTSDSNSGNMTDYKFVVSGTTTLGPDVESERNVAKTRND
jgi:YD repeat-containing protein